MKVLLVNGSPHQHGCTYTALQEIAQTLEKEGIASETFWIGNKAISGCIGCRTCAKKGSCVFDDVVNEFLDYAADFDGYVFGSAVHYAGMTGAMTSFMDRLFYSNYCSGRHIFNHKPGAAIVSARRAGTTAALEQLNKYIMYAQMPVVSSCYWNMVHGSTAEDVKKDAEGLQTMRILARNMAWLLKCKEAGEKAGVPYPEQEAKIMTNFIR